MRFLFPVSSEYLHNRPVVFEGGEFASATLLPLFDREGAVRQVAVVEEDSGALYAFDPSAVELQWRWWKRLEIVGAVRRLRYEDALVLRPWWCFDPWETWASVRSRDVAEMLSPKNSSGKLRTRKKCWKKKREITTLWYRRDLSRVKWGDYGKKGQQQLVSFSACELPDPPELVERVEPAADEWRWRLEPFWTRSLTLEKG